MPRVVNPILKASVFLVRKGYVCICAVPGNQPVVEFVLDMNTIPYHPCMIIDDTASFGGLMAQTRITS